MNPPLPDKVSRDAQDTDRVLEALRALPKSPLTRRGMSPLDLLKFAGTIPVETLDAIEAAIEEGCGRVEAHGQ